MQVLDGNCTCSEEGKAEAKTSSVFDVLMGVQRKYDQLPKSRSEVNKKDVMYNKLLLYFRDNEIGFQLSQTNFGGDLTGALCDTLWMIDAQREKFRSRAIYLPFPSFVGYNNWKQNKKREPILHTDELKQHIDRLCILLAHPWFSNKTFLEFKSQVSSLVDCMQKYEMFLQTQRMRSLERHAQHEPVRGLSDNWIMKILEPGPENVNSAALYEKAKLCLDVEELYKPVSLLDLQPSDKYERRCWLDNFRLPYPVCLFAFHHGNYLGNVNFVWKLPVNKEERDESMNSRTVQNVLKNYVPQYSTRAMRNDFTNLFHRAIDGKVKPAIMRSIFRYCTQDHSAPENAAENEVDLRLENFIFQCDDTELIFDLRKHNGRKHDAKFDPFWHELDRFLEEKSAVHERRQADHLYLPFATSVEALKSEIAERLPADAPIPSTSWLRLNFWPNNPFAKSAGSYTGKFKVKFAVQQRLHRAQHEDAGYTAYQFTLMKQMAVLLREHVHMICVDDKAIVPIGEPQNPISTGVRAHNKSLVPVGTKLVASDHNFHVAGIVPSVLFHVDIPSDPRDSFHKGQIHVTLKDKVFQPSSAMRHTAENVAILRDVASTDDVNMDRPILMVYSDGGPDHRCTFVSVKLAALSTFVALDLDMYIAVRTGPMQSYANPAERAMSCLNLALQNVSLEREATDANMEMRLRGLTTLKKLRIAGTKDVRLQQAFVQSIEPVISILKQRFGRLKWQHTSVMTHDAAPEEAISEMSSLLKLIDETIDVDPMTIKSIQKYKKLSKFIDKHSQSRQYTFQIKKCTDKDCAYCLLNPVRLPQAEFASLFFLPDATPGADGKFKAFEEVYGEETSDSSRPSASRTPAKSDRDKANKAILVGDRVRGIVPCTECGKNRVVYSKKRLANREEDALSQVQEDCLYTCGSGLFPDGPYKDTIIVKESLNCSSPMETAYYAGKTQTFSPVCFHCGSFDLYEGLEIQQRRKDFGIVRSICNICYRTNKPVVTRNAVHVNNH